jgi:hypothetical protein
MSELSCLIFCDELFDEVLMNSPEFEFIEIGLTCSEIDSEFELIWNER